MLRWARIVIAVFALAAALAGAVTDAGAAKPDHPSTGMIDHGHAGMGMMTGHCPGSSNHNGTATALGMPCCFAASLALPDRGLIMARTSAIAIVTPLTDDRDRGDPRAPPDLRPPIA